MIVLIVLLYIGNLSGMPPRIFHESFSQRSIGTFRGSLLEYISKASSKHKM